MPRAPQPLAGSAVSEDFPSIVAAALALNPAIHDGAILAGRSDAGADYRIVGWSHRLHPPESGTRAEPNRGSAYNSCLAMSAIKAIDRVYLISKGSTYKFQNTTARLISDA